MRIFQVGDIVTWFEPFDESIYIGKIIQVIKPLKIPKCKISIYPHQTVEYLEKRKEESYIVQIGNKKFWPKYLFKVSDLSIKSHFEFEHDETSCAFHLKLKKQNLKLKSQKLEYKNELRRNKRA